MSHSNGQSGQQQQSQVISFVATTEDIESKKVSQAAVQKPLVRSSTFQSSETDGKTTQSRKWNLFRRRQKVVRRIEGPPYHTMDLDTVARLLQTDLVNGLSEDSIDARRREQGFNELEGDSGVNPVKLFVKQFINILVFILLVATVVSFVFKDWVEGGVIGAIMFLNAIIGFTQEYNAEKTMDSLRQMASPTSVVVRSGQETVVPTRELLVGDLLVLKSGDVVGADARIVKTSNMDVDEALLTGESMPVNKVVNVLASANVPLGDRVNMTYSSTTVSKGRGQAIVTAIGMDTEIGQIAKRLVDSDGNRRTPLQRSIDHLGMFLFGFAAVAIIVIFSTSKFKLDEYDVLYAISTAIAAVPEGLLAVLTLTQAFGVHAMAKSNALVRRLVSLELLGAVTNICSDKTGTLTQSKMVLVRMWRPDTGFYKVSGTGFDCTGQVSSEASQEQVTEENMTFGMQQLVHTASLCNMSTVETHANGEQVVSGDPTEIALQVFGHKLNMGKPKLTDQNGWQIVAEYPFDSSIKRMSVLAQNKDGATYVYMKGATERILGCCIGVQGTNEQDIKLMSVNEMEAMILPQVEELARGGLRVLTLAMRKMKTEFQVTAETFQREDIECDMIFLGLVGIYDPPREESKLAVERCHMAGITVHMLTGDHLATATAIAREVSILPPDYGLGDSKPNDALVMSAQTFDQLTEDEIDALPELPLVVARCSPDTKVKMIEALHRRKKIAGMTGDGVNDSPSLKIADVGISMGKTGSDVAKQASDIVLVDDNFATIVAAITEGRRVFANISRFVVHLLTANVGLAALLIVGLAFRDHNGKAVFLMAPLEILFTNCLATSPLAMGLGLEPVHPRQMLLPPRRREHGLFRASNLLDIFFYGIVICCLTLVSFVVVLHGEGDGHIGTNCNKEYSVECDLVFRARGTAFVVANILLLLNAFTCRDLFASVWNLKFASVKQNWYLYYASALALAITLIALYVPVLNTEVFKHAPIEWPWGLVIGSCLVYMATTEAWKYGKRRFVTP